MLCALVMPDLCHYLGETHQHGLSCFLCVVQCDEAFNRFKDTGAGGKQT